MRASTGCRAPRGWPRPTSAQRIYSIAVGPRDPDVAYLTMDFGGVFKTTDGGQHWLEHDTGITSKYDFFILIRPLSPNVLCVGTADDVFRSSNSGGSWAPSTTRSLRSCARGTRRRPTSNTSRPICGSLRTPASSPAWSGPGTKRGRSTDPVRRGELYWASLPEPYGRRPALVISRSASLGTRTRVTVAPVTSTVRGIASEVPVGKRQGVRTGSVVTCDNVQTLLQDRLDPEPIGRLSVPKTIELDRALRFALGIRS
jgi:mRNA interferase MazF